MPYVLTYLHVRRGTCTMMYIETTPNIKYVWIWVTMALKLQVRLSCRNLVTIHR